MYVTIILLLLLITRGIEDPGEAGKGRGLRGRGLRGRGTRIRYTGICLYAGSLFCINTDPYIIMGHDICVRKSIDYMSYYFAFKKFRCKNNFQSFKFSNLHPNSPKMGTLFLPK